MHSLRSVRRFIPGPTGPALSRMACVLLLSGGCQQLDESASPVDDGGRAPIERIDGSGQLPRVEASTEVTPEADRDRCPETTPVPRASNAAVELSIEVTLGGKPLIFGERNDLPAGGSVTPLDLRFYAAHLALLRDRSERVHASMVTATGAPAPYDVHLFNADDPASSSLRLAAPAGDYTGLELVFGLDDDCNAATLRNLKPPLSAASQMSWPHVAGYLFLRFEGQVDAGADAGDAGSTSHIPKAIHMGGSLGPDFGSPSVLSAPIVQVATAIHLEATVVTRRKLRVVMDEIFRGANMPIDSSQFFGPPSPETWAGERLRQSAARLAIFELVP